MFIQYEGRIKDIVVTAGGENISPVPIEDRLKLALTELVSNCIVVGDQRKFLVALVTLRVDSDPATNSPTDRITADCLAFLKKRCGLPDGITRLSDLLSNPNAAKTRENLNELFDQALDKINLEVHFDKD